MTQRIYIAADRVTVSKPGYSAVSPPAVDYKYLALDSRLPPGRPLEIGLLPNYAMTYGGIVNYSTNYPDVPAVDVIAYGFNGTYYYYNKSMAMRDSNGSTAYNRTSFYLALYSNGFQLLDDMQFVRSSMFGTTYPGFYYVVWQTW